jgi:hypothetical protein
MFERIRRRGVRGEDVRNEGGGAERTKRQELRAKSLLRGLSARFWEGLGNEGGADYADFEICLDCLDVVLKPRICANARESGLEGRRDRFAVRSAAPVRSKVLTFCEIAFGCETGLEGEEGRGMRGEEVLRGLSARFCEGLGNGVWGLDAGGNGKFYILNSRRNFEIFPSDPFGSLDDFLGGGFYA